MNGDGRTTTWRRRWKPNVEIQAIPAGEDSPLQPDRKKPGSPEGPTLAWLSQGRKPTVSRQPRVWVARKGSRIVGRQAAIPATLLVDGRRVEAFWAVDLLVHPEWRLKGVGPLLMEALGAERPVVLAMGISDSAYRVYRRAGWLDLGYVPRLVRPLRPVRMAGLRKGRSQLVDRVLGPVVTGMDGTIAAADRVMAAFEKLRGYTLDRISRFDRKVDAIVARAGVGGRVRCARDLRFLRWRFDEDPDAPRYARYCLRRRDKLLGYAVLSRRSGPHGPILEIVDLFVSPNHLAPFLHLLMTTDESRGALSVHCTILDQRAHRILRLVGFVPRVPDLRLMAHLREDAHHLRPLLSRAARWRLTMADGDNRIDSAAVKP